VPQTDSVVEVAMLDATPPASPQPPAAKTRRAAPKPKKKARVLRVPDF
jgi:hypothetical protein